MIVEPTASSGQEVPDDIASAVCHSRNDSLATNETNENPSHGDLNIKTDNDAPEVLRSGDDADRKPTTDAELSDAKVINDNAKEEIVKEDAVDFKISEDVENIAASANGASSDNNALPETASPLKTAAPKTYMRQSSVSSNCFLILTETFDADSREAVPLFHKRRLPISSMEWREWKKPKKSGPKKKLQSPGVGVGIDVGAEEGSVACAGKAKEKQQQHAKGPKDVIDEPISVVHRQQQHNVVLTGVNDIDDAKPSSDGKCVSALNGCPPSGAELEANIEAIYSGPPAVASCSPFTAAQPANADPDCGPALAEFKNKHKRSMPSKGEGVIHTCPFCSGPFKRMDCLCDHIDSVHDNRAYLCLLCGDHVYQRRRRGEHLRTHQIAVKRGAPFEEHYRTVNRSDVKPLTPRKKKLPKASVTAKAMAKTVATARPIATSSFSHFNLDGEANVMVNSGAGVVDNSDVNAMDRSSASVVVNSSTNLGTTDANKSGATVVNSGASVVDNSTTNVENFEADAGAHPERQPLASEPQKPNEIKKLSQPHLLLQEMLEVAPRPFSQDIDSVGSNPATTSLLSYRSQHHQESGQPEQQYLSDQRESNETHHNPTQHSLPSLSHQSISQPSPQQSHQQLHSHPKPSHHLHFPSSSSHSQFSQPPFQRTTPPPPPQPQASRQIVLKTTSLQQPPVHLDQPAASPQQMSPPEPPSLRISNPQKPYSSQKDELYRLSTARQQNPNVVNQNHLQRLHNVLSQAQPSQIPRQQLQQLQQQLYSQQQQPKPTAKQNPPESKLDSIAGTERKTEPASHLAKDPLMSGLSSAVLSAFTGGSLQRSDVNSRSQPPVTHPTNKSADQQLTSSREMDSVQSDLWNKPDHPTQPRHLTLNFAPRSLDPRLTTANRAPGAASGPIIKVVHRDPNGLLDRSSKPRTQPYSYGPSLRTQSQEATECSPENLLTETNKLSFNDLKMKAHVPDVVPRPVVSVGDESGGGGRGGRATSSLLASMMNSNDPISTYLQASSFQLSSNLSTSSNQASSSKDVHQRSAVPPPVVQSYLRAPPPPHLPSTQQRLPSSDLNLSFSSFLDHGKS